MSKRKAALFLFMHVGHWRGIHAGAWREPDGPENPTLDFAFIKKMVLTAERGKFHGVFLSDVLALLDNYSHDALARTVEAEQYEPFTLCSALAACTSKIGLALTANTTYNEPYHVARKFASLDHLSGGRAAWNIVAGGSNTEAQNFSVGEHIDHTARYARAKEFVEVVTGLWDGWDDDAFVRDKESGVFFDVDKMHPLNHKGKYFSVTGPVTIARPVQGHPVLAQAGSSAEGLEFAAGVADIIFTHQHDVEKAREFYAGVKEQIASRGRNPDDVLVLPGMIFLLGRTQAEADEKLAHLDTLGDPRVGLKRLAFMVDFDLSDYPLDDPVPDIPVTERGSKTLQRQYVEMARKKNMTVREFAKLGLNAGTIAVTPEGMADRIEEWVTTRAADGFNLTLAEAASLDLFVDYVVPELRRRGIFHDDYHGSTLREYLGLPRPRSRYAQADASAVA